MHNLDFDGAKSTNISDRFPYIEYPTPGFSSMSRMESPRLLKSHLPPSILIGKSPSARPKIVSIVREPKDTVVSYYYFSRMNTIIGYDQPFDQFVKQVFEDKVAYGPIWKFYSELDTLSKDPEWGLKILIVSYEGLMRSFESEVNKICNFLGRPELNQEEMTKLKDHSSFREMSLNPSVNFSHWDDLGLRKKSEALFMRKGEIGDSKRHFSKEQAEHFDSWFERMFKTYEYTVQ